MKKRSFIKMTLLSLFPASLSYARTDNSKPLIADLTLNEFNFTSSLFTPRFLRSFGRQYLGQFPLENDQNILATLLFNETQCNTTNLYTGVNLKIKMDFLNSNLVEIDGWLLSKTEARQYAFLSLCSAKERC